MAVPGYLYDDAITEALMRVARENEYLIDDADGDEGKIIRYRNLYKNALTYVAGELRDYMLIKETVITQPVGDAGVPEGWGYLPLDFVTFAQTNEKFNVSLHSENGKKIIEAVGYTIQYMALPKFVDSLWYNINEAIIYKFLYNCSLLDGDYAKSIPMLMDLHNKTMQRAAIEMGRLNKNKSPDVPRVTTDLSTTSSGVGTSLIKRIFGN